MAQRCALAARPPSRRLGRRGACSDVVVLYSRPNNQEPEPRALLLEASDVTPYDLRTPHVQGDAALEPNAAAC